MEKKGENLIVIIGSSFRDSQFFLKLSELSAAAGSSEFPGFRNVAKPSLSNHECGPAYAVMHMHDASS